MSTEAKEKKAQIVARLEDALTRCSVGVLTDYRGLSVAEVTALRRKLRQAGIEYRVVKNTLARLAAERAGKADLGVSFQGPIAIAFGYGDITEPARVLMGHIDSQKSELAIRGGFLGDRQLTPAEVITLAKLPPREVLLAMVLRGMQSPITGLVNCLASPIRGMAGVLQARIKQLEGE
ncbi:MAG: 50S ribosomal protein L10 [Dehalococcoidales bacterium]|nr:50S ribosomal protein L10 [Dehalococcoidales bacterium]